MLLGRTRGYLAHPQLERFRESEDPVGEIGAFLAGVRAAATERGYRFDETRINRADVFRAGALEVTDGQLGFERAHLAGKLQRRDPERLASLPERPDAHPLFRVVSGPVASWERV